MKVFVVAGTRPEAIKMAPVYKALEADGAFDPVLVATAQHREMLDQVLDWFGLAPHHDLNLMKDRQSLSGVLSRAVSGLDALIESEKPDAVLAQGDTTTVLAAALAAFHRETPFGHVEAGLRTYDLTAPFPEEGNRALAGRVTKWHFAPTERAAKALAAEKVPGEIHILGNTVIDALIDTADRVDEPKTKITRERMVLITGHRRENHGDRFRMAFGALAELASRFPDADFVYPVHLNPNVRDIAFELLSGLDNFQLIDPVPYPEMVALMKRATLILTDSGGIQEEAPTFGAPVLVMRDTTERQEAVEAGVCELVGVDPQKILGRATELLGEADPGAHMRGKQNPFGDGKTAHRIAQILKGEAPEPYVYKG